jgi:hypothetical protein
MLITAEGHMLADSFESRSRDIQVQGVSFVTFSDRRLPDSLQTKDPLLRRAIQAFRAKYALQPLQFNGETFNFWNVPDQSEITFEDGGETWLVLSTVFFRSPLFISHHLIFSFFAFFALFLFLQAPSWRSPLPTSAVCPFNSLW